jgi:electron transfer flavoprotein alpha subunit
MSILAVMEQRDGAWHRMSWETLAAAQQLARELDLPAIAAVPGSGVDALAGELAAKQLDQVCTVDHELLRDYTPDGYALALRQLVEQLKPTLVLFPHTYQVRDFLPKLATALDRVAVSDVVSHRVEGGDIVLVRQLFQGKVNADIRFAGAPPWFASLQAGASRAALGAEGSARGENFVPRLSAADIRARPREWFRESGRAVDLSMAEIIVAVGRGIKEADNLPLTEKLAQALGAEMAASRPICDAGWLPMERQVGSSGQTVAPKLYVAVGISGAIQHLVGMKASKVVVAINKDADAPIFEAADYGIVGDLLQVVPELIAAIQSSQS